jgi:hypothetical protein
MTFWKGLLVAVLPGVSRPLYVAGAPTNVDWASLIVETVGAVGTIAALVVAIIMGKRQLDRLREDQHARDAEARKREARARRAQAEQVSAIAHVHSRVLPPQSQFHPASTRYGAWADVMNASALPIYGVRALVPTSETPSKVWVVPIGFVPGNDTGHEHLPPRADRALDRQPLGVVFRDSGGLWWHRDAGGYLEELEEDPHPPGDDEPPAPGHEYAHH